MTRSLALTLNALGLYAVALVLLIAFAAQLLLNELPCPLCLLQRIQFAMLAVGPILNLRFGPRPSHYAVSLLTAIAGAAFAARQILLHIMPGDLGYGSALLGYHYYTWAFIGFAVAIIALAAMLLFDQQFNEPPLAATVSRDACNRLKLLILQLSWLPLGAKRYRRVSSHVLPRGATVYETDSQKCPRIAAARGKVRLRLLG
jgi:disulfide bond formation protein DsbB